MKSIVAVTAPASTYDLTTLASVLQEMQITGESEAVDSLLQSQITQASQSIATYCNRVLALESVEETFWPDPNALNHRGGGWWGSNFWAWRGSFGAMVEILRLDRYPVKDIYSVTLDDIPVDPSEYRLDAAKGFLYRLDDAGYPWTWWISKSVVVDYTGGYSPIPSDLDRAARLFVQDAYSGSGKDPRIKGENVFGVASQQFSLAGDFPALVQALASPYRRQVFA